MKFLKGLALTLLSLLLFLSLSIFSLAFLLNSTILNPDFITSELDRFEVAPLAEEIISEQIPAEELPEELKAALINTITKLEPVVKEQVSAATYSVYDYLLGKRESPDLAHTLRNTFLSSDFVTSLVDELDIASLAREFISEQLTEEIPEEMEFMVGAIDDTLVELEPWIKEQVSAAADPILDYLLGESQSLSIVIPLEPVKESLEVTLKEAFLESPPPEFADLPQSTLEQYFDEFFQEFSNMLPATFVIDESVLGTEMPAEFASAIAEAEEDLAQARQGIAEGIIEAEKGLEEARGYVSYFQLGYNLLIVFMLLLILGIVFIHRQVRGATRGLGITFLTFGALELIGIFVAKYFAEIPLAQLPPIPSPLQTWLPQFLNNFLAPLHMLSIGLIVGGVALLIVSFVYRPRQPV